MARPSPVPPYLLAVVDEAWENSWNSLPICSGVMPMPVSATAMVTQSRPFSFPWRASTVIVLFDQGRYHRESGARGPGSGENSLLDRAARYPAERAMGRLDRARHRPMPGD